MYTKNKSILTLSFGNLLTKQRQNVQESASLEEQKILVTIISNFKTAVRRQQILTTLCISMD